MKRAMLIAAAVLDVRRRGPPGRSTRSITSTSERKALFWQDHQHDGDGDHFRAANRRTGRRRSRPTKSCASIFENSPDGLLSAQEGDAPTANMRRPSTP